MIAKNITKSRLPFSGCGIVGAFAFQSQNKPDISGRINFQAMLNSIRHRGPEAEGTWSNRFIRMGHRRLSILDLSENGNQPMTRDHLTIISNGEVYNFMDIRRSLELDGFVFTSGTDTEVILRAYQRWGADALQKFNGMFAMAIWDNTNKTLFLARDRIGIKPLYYYIDDALLLFGSEVQALMHSGYIPPEINWETAHNQLLINTYYHHDHNRTLVKNVFILPAGYFMLVKPDGQSRMKCYWEIPAEKTRQTYSRVESVNRLQELLEDSVRLRLVSDVPVAAFLSGGMDSSVICELACRQLRNDKLTAVTVTYSGGGEDIYSGMADRDLEYSRIVARLLEDKVNHKIVHNRPAGICIDSIDETLDLAYLTDDDRHLTVLRNYRTIKEQNFKVVLNGQGADELMGGYSALDAIMNIFIDVQKPDIVRLRDSFPHMAIPDRHTLHESVLEHVNGIYEYLHHRLHSYPGNLLEKVHRYFMNTGLQRILRFEDLFSMHSSIECRVPFLDHRIIEWAFSIPFFEHIRVEDRMGKMLLRLGARSYLPKTLIDRPKQAFPAPDQQQVRHALLKLYRDHHSEIVESEFIRRFYNKRFLIQEKPDITSRELWLLIAIWRWEIKLDSYRSITKLQNN